MRINGLMILLLVIIMTGCEKNEVSFPVEAEYYENITTSFNSLWKKQDPQDFEDLADSIIIDMQSVMRISPERRGAISPEDSALLKAWDKLMSDFYHLIVDNHVEAYILKKKIEEPRYYETRKQVSNALDKLILQMDKFMHETYPMRELDVAYYKNLPEITSRTADAEGNRYYIVKVNIGYLRDEKATQTAVNSSKTVFVDIVRSYFSSMTEQEILSKGESDLKAGLQKEINDYLVQFYSFKSGKMEGVKFIAISKIQTFVFN